MSVATRAASNSAALASSEQEQWNAHRNGEGVRRGCVGNRPLLGRCRVRRPRSVFVACFEDGVEDGEATRLTVEAFPRVSRGIRRNRTGRACRDAVKARSPRPRHSRSGAGRPRAGAPIFEMWERDDPKLLPPSAAPCSRKTSRTTDRVRSRFGDAYRPPKRTSSGLAAGDVLAIDLPQRVALLRVVRVRCASAWRNARARRAGLRGHRGAATGRARAPWSQSPDPIVLMHALSPDTRLFALVIQSESIHSRPVSGRCKQSAPAPATSRRRCQAPAFPGPNSPSATAVERRAGAISARRGNSPPGFVALGLLRASPAPESGPNRQSATFRPV